MGINVPISKKNIWLWLLASVATDLVTTIIGIEVFGLVEGNPLGKNQVYVGNLIH